MESQRLRYLVTGLVLFVVAGTSFYFSYSTLSRQSTFSFGPQLWYRIAADLASGTTIEGQFTETSGQAVNFSIMSSAQYTSFAGGMWNGSLYWLGEVISSSISYTTTARDTYYLVFLHGSGLNNNTQTVSFARTFTNLNPVFLVSGVGFVAIGMIDLFLAFRKAPSVRPPPPGGTSLPPSSPPPS